MNMNPPPILDETEQRWRATAAPGRCDDALTALHLDISPLSLCSPQTADDQQNGSIRLARQDNCANTDVRDLYVADHDIGQPGHIADQAIGARLVWDPRFKRDCYFLWIMTLNNGDVVWEGCRRAITPTGKYGIHRYGNGCEVNASTIHIIVS